MTPGENGLVLGASILGATLAAWRMAAVSPAPLMVLLAAAMGFDIIGGAICNGTATTRAWYHRPGQGWRQRLLFVAPHLAYVGLVAGLSRGDRFDVPYACIFGLGLIGGGAAIVWAPRRLRTPVAFAAFLFLLVGLTIGFGPTPGLEWFAPALLLKLFVGHLAGPGPRPPAG